MLKFRFMLAAAVFGFAVLLSPLPSQATPRVGTVVAGLAPASLLEKVEQWWSSLLTGGRPVQQERSHGPKHGCGMDPNGKPVCETNTSTTPATEPVALDPSGPQ